MVTEWRDTHVEVAIVSQTVDRRQVGCQTCVHIDVQSPLIEGVHGSSLLLINKNIQCTLKGDSHFFFSEVAWGFIPGTCTSSKVFSALCFKILPKFMMRFSQQSVKFSNSEKIMNLSSRWDNLTTDCATGTHIFCVLKHGMMAVVKWIDFL